MVLPIYCSHIINPTPYSHEFQHEGNIILLVNENRCTSYSEENWIPDVNCCCILLLDLCTD